MDALSLNRMLANRVKDLAGRKPARSRVEHEQRTGNDRDSLLRCLGLYPLPPRTDLMPKVAGTIRRDGYRIDKIAYYSRPGVRVTAHLYLPEGSNKAPIVLLPHGHWQYKKSEPVNQAHAIGLALQGIAALVIDSPGYSWDDNETNERRAMGPHDDPFLCMGAPVTGVYVWDVVRGLDYLETRAELDTQKVGVAGCSGGGHSATYAFAVDPRIACCAPICYATSLTESAQNGCLCNHLPGSLTVGDRADVLAMRAPAPILLIGALEDAEFPPEGHRKTLDKLKAIYRLFGSENKVSLELFEGGHDLNRRMREATLAFFAHHLQGAEKRSYIEEKRPLTDSAANPYPANTALPTDPELLVLGEFERSTTTFRDLLHQALSEPYPQPYDPAGRLVSWGRYGRLLDPKRGKVLRIVEGLAAQGEPNVVHLPVDEIDLRLCIYLGLSPAELFAQVLHLMLPGGPEGWETVATGGSGLTSMIASMRTLVGNAQPSEIVEEVVADGQVASMTARHLALLRPNLRVQVSHKFEGWKDLVQSGVPQLSQPQARYLAWPFVTPSPTGP